MEERDQFLREDPNMAAARALVIPGVEREQRTREAEHGLASVRLEGLEPSDDAKALFGRYIDGELSAEELEGAFALLFDRKYGPIRLPGN